MQTHRLTVTLGPRYGEDHLDQVTSALVDRWAECDPVADLSTSEGDLSVTISFDGGEAYEEAFRVGAELVASAFVASGVEWRQVTEAHLTRLAPRRELQAA